MKNEVIILPDGTKVYRDRSVGVVLISFCLNDGIWYTLANKRGVRTSECKLKWNSPSGYLDWDETGEECAARETKEECGLDIPAEWIVEAEHSTSPKENRQNIIFRYYVLIPDFWMNKSLSFKDSEEDEVREIRWIPINELDCYDFAWNQVETIKRIFNTYIDK